jgi:Gpi18-like mannosyltransferase
MSLTLAALWSIGLLAAYLLLHQPRLRALPAPRYAGAVLLIAALVARLVPNLLVGAGDNYDMASYDLVGRLVLQGEEVYRATAEANRYPYLPLLLYWLAAAVRAAEATGWDFAALVRILPILADVTLAVMIYLLLKARRGSQEAWFAGLLYSLNPVAVFVCAYHGQFDPLASLLMVAAAASLAQPAAAGGLLGLGILVKSWPVLAVPSLLANLPNWRSRILFTCWWALCPWQGWRCMPPCSRQTRSKCWGGR